MDHHSVDNATCPFCPFSDPDAQFVSEHIEFCHPENGTSDAGLGGGFTVERQETLGVNQHQPDAFWNEETQYQADKYLDCPHGCGEVVTNAELPTHLDLHFAEEVANDDAGSSQPGERVQEPDICQLDGFQDDYTQDKYDSTKRDRSNQGKGSLREASAKGKGAPSSSSSRIASIKRLGKAELGPHAHEKRMPSWLLKMLEKGPKTTQSNKISSNGTLIKYSTVENETAHVIPVLFRLCEQDTSVQRAFFCSPNVRHIFEMPCEGGFCGYRNIQMLISYIEETQSPGYEHFPQGVPTILVLQDMIERAWDMGFNSVGKAETGGIRGTRKYIGTPEAQALFSSLGIQCEANSLAGTKDLRAHDALYMDVAAYFRPACFFERDDKVVNTNLPPIYFQHQGHSLTIIGFEIRDNGSANLLVFDPMFKTSPAIKLLIGTSAKSSEPARLLKAYRRSSSSLQKYSLFEILKLPVPSSSSSPARQ